MQFYPFSTPLQIMKPNKVNKKASQNQKNKLSSIMNSSQYVREEKIDGIHLTSIGGRLYSIVLSKETGFPSDKTDHCPHLATVLSTIGEFLVLDGEAYLPDGKCNDVTAITNSLVPSAVEKQHQGQFIKFLVYDILRDAQGNWLTNEPWSKRRTILEKVFQEHDLGEHIQLHSYYECQDGNTQAHFDQLIREGKEGLVLKHKDSKYYPGKRPMWVWMKLKAEYYEDVVVIGFTPPTRLYQGKHLDEWPYWEHGEPVTSHYAEGLIGSIRVAKYNEHGELIPLGTTSGISDKLRRDMTMYPDKYINKVITIKAMEQSEHGFFRHSSFWAFHPDKNPQDCILED